MRWRRASYGFTLIEVVISLALLSLIMLGLLSAMRTLAESSARVEVRSDLGDALRIVPIFLDHIIGSAVSRARIGGANNAPQSWFSGGTQELQWLGIMPARHGVGGMTHFRLLLQEGVDGQTLTLQYAPFMDDRTPPDWTQAESEVVAEGVRSVAFSYLGGVGGDWQSEWDGRLGLPAWVSIKLDSAQGLWPWMVFRVKQTGLRSIEELK